MNAGSPHLPVEGTDAFLPHNGGGAFAPACADLTELNTSRLLLGSVGKCFVGATEVDNPH
jgi:hypothetical protein